MLGGLALTLHEGGAQSGDVGRFKDRDASFRPGGHGSRPHDRRQVTVPSLPADGLPPRADAEGGPRVDSPHQARPHANRLARALWLSAGSLMLVFAIVGVIVPGWPTTIFVILALACYARSSQRFYDRVANNRLIGRHARAFRETGVMPRRTKQIALGTMWPFVAFAVFFGIPDGLWWARLLTVALAAIGSTYILRLPSRAP